VGMRRGALHRFLVPLTSFLLGFFANRFFLDRDSTPGNILAGMLHERDLDILILIPSSPSNLKQRTVVRETWLSGLHSQIRGYFVVGVDKLSRQVRSSLEEEKEEHGDLILLDMVDSYDTLSEKVLKMIEYASDHFTARLLMKADDDSFVNTFLLVKEIKHQFYHDPNLYWGYFKGNAPIFKQGRWAEPEYHLCDKYIPYAQGGGYLLGWQVVKHIARNAGILKLYRSEDVSVGTWLAGTRVKPIHDERFDTEWKSRGCQNHMLVRHPVTEAGMRDMWDRLTRGDTLCSKEIENRKSYSYNWKVPPSQCCRP